MMRFLFILLLGCTLFGSAGAHYLFPEMEMQEDFALKPYKLPV